MSKPTISLPGSALGTSATDLSRLQSALTHLDGTASRIEARIEVMQQSLRSLNSLFFYVWEQASRDTADFIGALKRYHGKHINCGKLNKAPLWEEVLKHIEPTDTGYVLEFGVYKGTSLTFFAEKLKCRCFGFDSFEGLPESDGIWEKSSFGLAAHEIPTFPSNVTLVKGWFSDTLAPFLAANDLSAQTLSLLHIDCDLYSSTVTILDNLAPYIQVGTVILFDEYWNYPGWRDGEFKAWNEFVARTGIEYEHLCYNNHEQLAIKITARP